jgi:hypothetical protein
VGDQRFSTLVAALGFAQLPPQTPSLITLHGWLGSWAGIRWIAATMAAEHHALTLTRNDNQWTATFRLRRLYTAPRRGPIWSGDDV